MVQELEKRTRIDVADVLRGLAVMGIIVLHSIEHFNFYSFPDTSTQGAWLNFSDKAIWDGLFFMFGGKAYAVFALLFGFSFFIQDVFLSNILHPASALPALLLVQFHSSDKGSHIRYYHELTVDTHFSPVSYLSLSLVQIDIDKIHSH